MVRHSLVDEITGDLDDLNTFMMNLKEKEGNGFSFGSVTKTK